MDPAGTETSEAQYSALLAACRAPPAVGGAPPLSHHQNLPPDVRRDLEQDLACVELLRRVLPGQAAPSAELPWAFLGRFQLRRELGQGAFGIVYLAYDPRLGREV